MPAPLEETLLQMQIAWSDETEGDERLLTGEEVAAFLAEATREKVRATRDARMSKFEQWTSDYQRGYQRCRPVAWSKDGWHQPWQKLLSCSNGQAA
jgi:hypothetical protein